MAAAFDAVGALPAHAEAIRRLHEACERGGSPDSIAEPIESDPGLAIAVLRAANDDGLGIGSAPAAVEALGAARVRELADSVGTYDPLADDAPAWAWSRERFRAHAATVRNVADRIAVAARIRRTANLALAALLHDVGRLVIGAIYPERPLFDHAGTPEARALHERRELGFDHAVVGAVLVRRWAAPVELATAIEHHHSAESSGIAAVVRLADLIVHHTAGDPISAAAVRELAARLGMTDTTVRDLLYELPAAAPGRRRAVSPSPLSPREADALRGLAAGRVYKEIAADLGLSESTVRSHIHNMYKKIGASDRAQAVLIATEQGWI